MFKKLNIIIFLICFFLVACGVKRDLEQKDMRVYPQGSIVFND